MPTPLDACEDIIEIILIDDDIADYKLIQRLYNKIICSKRIKLRVFHDGPDALEQLRYESKNAGVIIPLTRQLFLIDIHLPTYDGFYIARQLQAMNYLKELLVYKIYLISCSKPLKSQLDQLNLQFFLKNDLKVQPNLLNHLIKDIINI